MKQAKDVDEYIFSAPKEVQGKLRKLRAIIKKAAPEAEEKISYGMPAFMLNGPLVYFAGYKSHIGIYPTSSGMITAFKELAKFKTGKGTLQFPNNQPLPLTLIKKAVEFRMKENLERKQGKRYG